MHCHLITQLLLLALIAGLALAARPPVDFKAPESSATPSPTRTFIFGPSSSSSATSPHDKTTRAAGQLLRLASVDNNVGVTIIDHAMAFAAQNDVTITVDTFDSNSLQGTILGDLNNGSLRYDAFVGSSLWVPQLVECCQDVPYNPASSSSKTASQKNKADQFIPALYPLTTGVRSVDTSTSDEGGYQWYDVLPFWQRKSVYRGDIYSIPLDGDVHFLYYRTDVLQRFNLSRPVTWEDMLETSRFLQSLPDAQRDWNGDGIPDYASCISSALYDVVYWWPWTIAASTLQTEGISQGIFFDPTDATKPRTASAGFQKALQLLKDLVDTSPPGVPLATCRQLMTTGGAVFSLDWGDTIILANSSAYRDYISVSKTPGSTEVISPTDPSQLVNCTLELCPYALIDSRRRIVNFTPYAAFGGWSAFVSNRASAASQELAVRFFTKIGGPAQSLLDVVNGVSGFQAYRYTHLDASTWKAEAFSAQSITGIINGVKEAISHPNMAVDISVPGNVFYILSSGPYFEGFFNGTISPKSFSQQLTADWNAITRTFGGKTQTNNYRQSLGQEPITFRYETSVSEGARISIIVIAAVAIALDFVFAALIFVHRENKIIKWSSRSFLLLMCVGALMVYIGLIVWMATPTDAVCVAALILILFGLFTLLSSIFARTFRLWHIFREVKQHRKSQLTDTRLFMIVLLILALLSVLIIVWCAVDMPQPVYTTSGFADDEFAYVCSSPDYPWAWFGAACGYFGFLLVVGMVLTWSTRNIVRSLNESRFLLLAVYNLTVCLGVFIVIALTVSAAIMMILLAYIVLLATFSSLCLILVPKFWGVFTDADVSLFFEKRSRSRTSTSTSNGNRMSTLPGSSHVPPQESSA